MSLDDLLQSILGGGSAGQRRSSENAGSGDPMADMLDAILGGGSASQQGGGLEDILGGMLGGAAGSNESLPQSSGQAGAGGLMDIISAILNGSAGGAAQEQSTSIIEGVSGKTGLSQMLVDLKAPGVTIRPIRDLVGEEGFNEITFDDVMLPEDALVGQEGAGWAQATSELAFERSGPDRYLSSHPLLEASLDALRDDPRYQALYTA